ncbi:MAG: transporter [Planctomycetes bacterium]|nr:transporter [Planctomycetota bacterium]
MDLPVGQAQNQNEGSLLWVNGTYSYQQSEVGIDDNEYPGQYRTTSNLFILRAGFQPVDELRFGLVLPFLSLSNRANDLEDFDLFGQGDASLVVDYSPWKGEQLLGGLSFRGGFKLPTGRAEKDLDLLQGPATLLQLGSGTLDFILGTQFTLAFSDFNVFGRIGLQSPLHDNSYEFKPSDMLNLSVGGNYHFLEIVTASLSLSTLMLNKDKVDGKEFKNSGGSFLFVTPAVSVDIAEGLSVNVSGRINFISNSYNPKNGTLFSLGLSWAISF